MKKKENYNKILTIAYHMFGRLGYERTSVALIADEMGFSKPALYNYFKSKEAIFEMLYENIVAEIIEGYKVIRKSYTQDSYKLYLKNIGYDTIEGLKNNAGLSRILIQFFLLGLRNETIRALTLGLEEASRAYYEEVLELGLACGCLEPKNKDLYVNMFLMMDQGIVEKSSQMSRQELREIWALFVDKIMAT